MHHDKAARPHGKAGRQRASPMISCSELPVLVRATKGDPITPHNYSHFRSLENLRGLGICNLPGWYRGFVMGSR
jgi:hypothetical protein